MGTNTDGQICYGVLFEEDHVFPWDFMTEGNLEDWWISRGIEDGAPFYPYTPEGEYKDGVNENDPRVAEYYDTRRAWLKDNPVPVVKVNVQHGDYPVYVLAVPDTVHTAHRGCPEKFDPAELTKDPMKVVLFAAFLKEHNLAGEPAWYLSSYWG